MSYDLCPEVGIEEIIKQGGMASRVLARRMGNRVVVIGHSAGGHMAACLLAREDCVSGAYSISGLFELSPLVFTTLNGALCLTPEKARELSPMYWDAPAGKTLHAVVGATESGEFLRQSRSMVEVWGSAGVNTQYGEIEDANHFTAIAPLADPTSSMCLEIQKMVRAAHHY